MAGINLWISTEEEVGKKWQGYKRTAFTVSTVALVIYLVVLAGGFGWWWYLQSRGTKVSAQAVDLGQKIAKKSDVEAMALLVVGRSRFVETSLAGRGNLTKAAQSIDPVDSTVSITGWERTVGGEEKISVAASSAQAIEVYAKQLGNAFDVVTLDRMSMEVGNVWQAVLSAKGGKI